MGGLGGEGAETLPHSLFEGFQSLEAAAACGDMNAHAFQGTMIHGKEDSRLAFGGGESCGHIRAPHVVNLVRGDAAIMDSGAGGGSLAVGGQEQVLPHQTQDPSFGGPEAGIP